MKLEEPLVSVLMTAYNRQQFIAEAIESVIASSYQNWELIIVDDGSKDDTVVIANKYAAKDGRMKVYINEKNLGDYPNRNKAVTYAKGEFVMFCDSDDALLPDGVAKCVETMLAFPNADIGMRIYNGTQNAFEIRPGESIQKHFFSESFLLPGPGGTILKREFLLKIGQYPIKYGPANDMYFNLKAASKGNIVMIPFEFLNYRVHEGQELNNKYGYLTANYIYLKDALAELDFPLSKQQLKWLSNKNKRRFIVNLAKYFMSTKNLKATRAAYKTAGFGLKDIFIAAFQK